MENKIQEKQMTQEDVLDFLDLCQHNNIDVYLDGGWGVDALLGYQSRPHADLDIALPHKHVLALRKLLEAHGYKDVPRDDTTECNFVLGDAAGHEIDFHSYVFDENSKNIFGVPYLPDHLLGQGNIAGRNVATIAPRWMVQFHTGYNVDENDFKDVSALCKKFGLLLPEDYLKFISPDQ